MADGNRVESGRAEDAVHKIQSLKKALARSRAELAAPGGPAGPAQRAAELSTELRLWEAQLEEIRCDFAELIAERDRWRITHDKLRERLDRHTLEPRSEPERKAPARVFEPERKMQVRTLEPVAPRAANESQDFTAIDRELERLNASMLRAFAAERSSE